MSDELFIIPETKTEPTLFPCAKCGELPHVKEVLTGASYSASWSKAEMHFGMAKAAWKLAARNEHGAAMVIEHMERAIEALKAMTLNKSDHPQNSADIPPEEQKPTIETP